MILEIAVVGLSSVLLVVYFVSFKNKTKPVSLKGKHVVITGGSLGIGKELAKQAVKEGASVTIVSRNVARLEAAKLELMELVDKSEENEQKIHYEKIDIGENFEATKKTFERLVAAVGPVDVLINNAGYSKPGNFSDLTVQDFETQMRTNYLGGVYCTKCVVDEMKKRKFGRLVFLSSQAGQIGVFGFTAYSGSKFAIKGFCEALQMELKPFNILLTIAYPPDTDTPGFKEENVFKPEETRLISEESGLYKPEDVAKSIIASLKNGEYDCSFGVNGFLLSTLSSGTSPVTNFTDSILQLFTFPLCRLVGIIMSYKFDRIVEKCVNKKN